MKKLLFTFGSVLTLSFAMAANVLAAEVADLFLDASAPNGGDGLTPATAFNTVFDGLDGAGSNSILHVAPGTYAASSTVTYNGKANITIIADDFDIPGSTIFDGAGTLQMFIANNSLNIKFIGITFRNFDASNSGGVIQANDSQVSFNNCRFLNNNTSVNGGAINYRYTTTISAVINNEFNHCEFDTNNASSDGGAIGYDFSHPTSIAGANLSIDDSKFTNNNSSTGGAISISSSSGAPVINQIRVQRCEFGGNNSGSGKGGSIFISNTPPAGGGKLTFEAYCSKFFNNDAGFGGAIHVESTSTVASDTQVDAYSSVFDNNRTGQNGGAINLEQADSNSSLTTNIQACLFATQTADIDGDTVGDGGAIFNNKGMLVIQNSVFAANTAAHGGAIVSQLPQNTTNIDHCTFVGNQGLNTPSDGAAVRMVGDGIAPTDYIITNSIFNNNVSSGGGHPEYAFTGSATGNLFDCGFTNTVATASSTTGSFVEPNPGFVSANNFQLGPGSPLIDRITGSGAIFDIKGLNRQSIGGTLADVGAFEHVSAGQGQNITGSTLASGYRMFTVPLPAHIPNITPRNFLEGVFGTYNIQNWRAFDWQSPTQDYTEFSDAASRYNAPNQRTFSFWLLSRDTTPMIFDEIPSSHRCRENIHIGPGEWQMVGHPFWTSVDANGSPIEVSVYNHDGGRVDYATAFSTGLVSEFYTFEGGAYTTTTNLERFRGYWIQNLTGRDIVLTFHEKVFLGDD